MNGLRMLIGAGVIVAIASAVHAAEKLPPAPACIKHQKMTQTHCDNNDSLTVEAVNNCDKKADVQICIGNRGRPKDDCGPVAHVDVGGSHSYWSCKPTGKYAVYARPAAAPKPKPKAQANKPKAVPKMTKERCESLSAFWVNGRCIAD
jgi:hypothetical protein